MLAPTADRVPAHTDEEVNRRIGRAMAERVRHFAAHPAGIDRRLRELDAEWDIERLLEANASTLAFLGIVLQHAVRGWCPPVPVLRRRGYRTAREIEIERVALKTLRGDFAALAPGGNDYRARREGWAEHAIRAARR
jgi:hypothetical protein